LRGSQRQRVVDTGDTGLADVAALDEAEYVQKMLFCAALVIEVLRTNSRETGTKNITMRSLKNTAAIRVSKN
jgi:hypothetical protein